ncbi:MAG: tetratricopeptide repeat protein [Deltaproteobacteria bacterium]|jgi:tetratricopeptide (TPR) repeat protein|nr:tetratricopeptide repeat protein [Deltaproteobacteria bacterium]
MNCSFLRRLLVIAAIALPIEAASGSPPADPYFREALFYAYQEDHLQALERLDTELEQHYGVDERPLDSLFPDLGRAEFSVGDFELRYRMHQRAGRAIRAVIEGDVDDAVRADAIYRLSRIHFQKGQIQQALEVLDKLPARIPGPLAEDAGFLRANILMSLSQADEAARTLEPLQGSKPLRGFSAYNLGIAFLESGQYAAALRSLDRAGRIDSDDRASRAIRDKSNLVLSTLFFEAGQFDRARIALDRIHLDGPYSNHALLRSGWIEATEERYERALVPWGILARKDPTDEAVQEVFLALPFAYSKLGVHGRAAVLYENAANAFGSELAKLDASVTSIENGAFLRALEGQEIRQDKDWVVRMRGLPDAPETFYLLSLMSSHDFQTGLQNYIDLMDMRRKLLETQRSLRAFEDVLEIRHDYYTPRLPEVDRSFRLLDAQMRLRLEQRDNLDSRLQKMLTTPAPRMLATAEEQELAARIAALRERVSATGKDSSRGSLHSRLERLEGVLTWRLEMNYHDRLTEVHDRLRELTQHIETLEERYESFVRTRQAAEHSHVGYDTRIADLHRRTNHAIERIDRVKKEQGRMLESVAIRELGTRRGRLVEYQDKARFAFADSYDRAVKAKSQGAGGK